MSSIAVLGPLSVDVVDGTAPRPGGAVFYAAQAYAALGSDVRATATCAEEDRALAYAPLAALGVDTEWVPSSRTARYTFHYEGDERIMRQEALADPWSPERALQAVGEAGFVHVGALVRSDFPPETLAALAGGDRVTLIDGQGLVRAPVTGPLVRDASIGDVLRYLTILKLSAGEAEILTGSRSPSALRALEVPEVLLTLGSEGAVVVVGDASEAIPAVSVDGVVDPTGAGDLFCAVYLHHRVAGAEPVEAARQANGYVAELLAAR